MSVTAALGLSAKVIDLAMTAIPAGSKALKDLSALKSKVKAMVDEGRDPTPAEFRELQNETNRLTDRLNAADDRLSGG